MELQAAKTPSVGLESSCHLGTLAAVLMEELGREVEQEEEGVRIVCREGMEVHTGRSLLRLLSPLLRPLLLAPATLLLPDYEKLQVQEVIQKMKKGEDVLFLKDEMELLFDLGITAPNTLRVFIGESYIKEKPAEPGNFKTININSSDPYQAESELLSFYKTIEVDKNIENENTELIEMIGTNFDKKGRGSINNEGDAPIKIKLVKSPMGWTSESYNKALDFFLNPKYSKIKDKSQTNRSLGRKRKYSSTGNSESKKLKVTMTDNNRLKISVFESVHKPANTNEYRVKPLKVMLKNIQSTINTEEHNENKHKNFKQQGTNINLNFKKKLLGLEMGFESPIEEQSGQEEFVTVCTENEVESDDGEDDNVEDVEYDEDDDDYEDEDPLTEPFEKVQVGVKDYFNESLLMDDFIQETEHNAILNEILLKYE